jgi:alpha/beta superfamily hydrolase
LPRASLEIVLDTDHFFWKREREVARIVADFAEKSLDEAA